jgi:hypothetical protein
VGLRNRYVKAEFWSDAKLFNLSDTEKLMYIGLWAEADDHGWLRWDPEQIAVDLRRGIPFPDGVASVERAGDKLAERGRLVMLECGHAHIPTFLKHQTRVGASRRTSTYLNEHRTQCHTSGTERQRAATSGMPRHAAGRDRRSDPSGPRSSGGEGRGVLQSDEAATSGNERHAARTGGTGTMTMEDHERRLDEVEPAELPVETERQKHQRWAESKDKQIAAASRQWLEEHPEEDA